MPWLKGPELWHRGKLLCSRCLELGQGKLVPVVKETMAEGQAGFGGQVRPRSSCLGDI